MNYNLQKNLSHLGNILLKISLLGILLTFSVLFSKILILVIFLVLIIVGIFSLFTLFFNNQYRELFNITESFNIFIDQSSSYIPTIAGLTLGFAITAFVFLIPDFKNRKSRKALIICSFIIIISFIILIYGISRGGSNV